MITRTIKFVNQLRNEEVGSPMVKSTMRFLKRIGAEEAGITALETAIILIAFVVVASVFAFTMLSAGTFSTERGKEAIYAGLTEVQSSMEIKGGVIAIAASAGASATVDSLVFTVANVLDGEAVNLSTGDAAQVVFEYRDETQRVALGNNDWSVEWLGNDTHDNAWRFDYPWEEYEWEGRTLLVPSLELYLKIEQSRGRIDRAQGIQAALGAVI